MVLQKRLNKLENLYKEKNKGEGHHMVMAFVETEIDKMEVYTASDGSGSQCLFSGNVPRGYDFLKTLKYEYLVEIPGPEDWAR